MSECEHKKHRRGTLNYADMANWPKGAKVASQPCLTSSQNTHTHTHTWLKGQRAQPEKK